MHIWRYYATFSNAEHNWLIPDNVQEEPPRVAARLSPTNLGFLFNARQAAVEFGYLTTPEFVQQNIRTLETMERLPKDHGHLYNWYDTRTLEAGPSALCLNRGQRQSGRFAYYLEGRLPRPAAAAAAESGPAGWLRRSPMRVGRLDVISRKVARSFERPNDVPWLDRLLSSVEIPQSAERQRERD